MNIADLIDLILQHSPALIVAIPLLGAFITPLISRLNDKIRNVFVILTLGLTASLVFLLASDVFTGNIHTYIFGSQDLTLPVVILYVSDSRLYQSVIGVFPSVDYRSPFSLRINKHKEIMTDKLHLYHRFFR